MTHSRNFNHPRIKTAIAACIAASFASGAYAAPGDLIGSPLVIGTSSINAPPNDGPRIASDANGNQVVAWVDYPSGNILAQRFLANGTPIGSAIQIAAASPSDQGGEVTNPAVAVNASGQFVVAWANEGPRILWQIPYLAAYSAWPVTLHARTFQADGTPVSSDIQFADMPLSWTSVNRAAVAIDDDGDFVVGWWQATQSIIFDVGLYPAHYSESQAVYARVYSAAGKAKIGPIKIDSGRATRKTQKQPLIGHLAGPVAVGMDSVGNFAIAWQSSELSTAGSASQINVRSYTIAGTASGTATVVNQTPVGTTSIAGTGGPMMAMNRSGQYVLTWSGCEYTKSDGSISVSVCARIFQPGGVPAGNEFSVNADLPLTYSYSYTWAPVAIDANGNFVIASNLERDNQELVRLFFADGTPRSASVALSQGQQQLYQAIGVSLDSQDDVDAIYLGLNSGVGSNPVLLQPISGN
jgi:hypothetical protein